MKNLSVNLENGETVERDLSQDEIDELLALDKYDAWIRLRAERNHRLASSDWTVLADTPTPTAAWKAYRQQLRDLPANTIDPFEPVWPTPPA